MKAVLTMGALLLALLLQSGLTQVAPAQARLFDPFLIVLVYCALVGGETHGMLAGALGGWIQDVYFGGSVVGISGLTKTIIGWGVGIVGGRFIVTGAAQRLMLVFAATLMDTLVFERLSSMFELQVSELSFIGLVGRATVNAILAAGAFEVVDRRIRGEAHS